MTPASFIKELLRRAVLAAFRTSDDVRSLTDADLAAASEELSAERHALTRSLLGHAPAGRDGGDGMREPRPCAFPAAARHVPGWLLRLGRGGYQVVAEADERGRCLD
jgi:hypothetical protein